MDTNNNRHMTRRPTTALSKLPSPIEIRVTPVADIYETADAFVIKLDMPGAAKETVTVSVEPGSLIAKGDVGQLHGEGADLVRQEISRKSYLREFTLGTGATHENVRAVFEEGVLTVTVPKTDDMKPKNIHIR
jgi:HSP20 family protein